MLKLEFAIKNLFSYVVENKKNKHIRINLINKKKY
jgi:hypothetical protein